MGRGGREHRIVVGSPKTVIKKISEGPGEFRTSVSVSVKTVRWSGGCGGVEMGRQRTFASMAWNGKGKVTRRERFLAEMDAVIPWTRLLGLIAPHYPKAGNGRQP